MFQFKHFLNVKLIQTVLIMKSVPLEIVSMHASRKNVELLQSVMLSSMMHIARALRITQGILILHVTQVRILKLNNQKFFTHINFLLVLPATVAPVIAGCDNNNDCPDHASCRNRLCINPCALDDPCSKNANCKVLNHEPVCTCPDGYIGDPTISCELRRLIYDKLKELDINVRYFSTPA